jgi:hypothetical protein
MLSKEKAKFKSALDRTNNQMNRDRQLKINPIHTLGTNANLIMKPNIFLILVMLAFKEFIEFFKNNWLIVSQILVDIINSIIKPRLAFML